MVEHKDTTYTAEESTGMVSEPAAACGTATQFRYGEATEHHVSMTFDVPATTDVETFQQQMTLFAKSLISRRATETTHIPNSYDEAIAMGCKDIEDFSSDLHKYIDKLCKEYDIR